MPGDPVQRRPMVDLEKARILALAKCGLGMAGWAVRVLPELRRRVQKEEVPQISEREAHALLQVAWRFRGQLKKMGAGDLVPGSEPPPLQRPGQLPPESRPLRITAKQREQQAKLERANRGEW